MDRQNDKGEFFFLFIFFFSFSPLYYCFLNDILSSTTSKCGVFFHSLVKNYDLCGTSSDKADGGKNGSFRLALIKHHFEETGMIIFL